MRRMTHVTKRRWMFAALVVIGMAAAGLAFAVASSRSDSSTTPFTVGQGVRVPSELMTDQQRKALAVSGATDQLYLLGKNGDHSYYRAVGAQGGTCYAVGNDSALLEVGCLKLGEEMPTALMEMSVVAIAPSAPSSPRLVAVEGIAADQVATVGIERKDGSLVTVRVAGNSYRFAPDAIPSDPVAIVALDESGAVIQRKTLG
jgi:hypothetical protein